jgi:DNA modification methylase
MWLMIGDEYADHLGLTLRQAGFRRRAWVKWYETFGANRPNNFNRTSRHLFYCVKDAQKFTFNADAVTRPSDRQLKYGDTRADPAGKTLDDVWQIPRLVGTASERIPDVPTQLPLELLRRVVLSTSDPGDVVLDPFSGSGTTGVVAMENGRIFIGIEKNLTYASIAERRLMRVSTGQKAA